MKPIFLFDIDGTLLSIERSFMHRLLNDLMSDLSLDPAPLYRVSFAGKTDHAIFRSLLGPHRNNGKLYEKLKSGYIRGMHQQLQHRHLQIFEAVRECLDYLDSSGHSLGLLTGNFREVAHRKLSLGKMNHHFTFGAYGCKHTDRNMLGKEAMDSFARQFGKQSEPGRYILIGDTPKDIACGRHIGARCIAVTTGHYPKEELARHNPDLILDSLAKPEKWLKEL